MNTSNPVASAATWNFGDGKFRNVINPVKIFANTGTFDVKLVSDFGACKDSVIKPVQVVAKPKVDFSGGPGTSCKAPLTVNFTSKTQQGVMYTHGILVTALHPVLPTLSSHTYFTEGFYSVKLVFTNAGGCKDSVVKKDFRKKHLLFPFITFHRKVVLRLQIVFRQM